MWILTYRPDLQNIQATGKKATKVANIWNCFYYLKTKNPFKYENYIPFLKCSKQNIHLTENSLKWAKRAELFIDATALKFLISHVGTQFHSNFTFRHGLCLYYGLCKPVN